MDMCTFFYEAIIARVLEEEGDEQDRRARKRPFTHRRYYGKGLPRLTVWWRRYIQDDFPDRSPEGKSFRRKFRLPYSSFKALLGILRESGSFPERCDAIGTHPCPLELLLLGSLRMLGRACTFDDLSDFTDISAEVHRRFFHKFNRYVATTLFPQHVRPPSSSAEITEAMRGYSAAGFEGCIGSIDCVHIPWGRCAANLTNYHRDRTTGTSRVFEVVVNHQRRIFSCTRGFFGSTNDKTIAYFDGFNYKISIDKLYTEHPYNLFDIDGVRHEERGIWVLCDNGYHAWRTLQYPLLIRSNEGELRWSRMAESLRKDIEQTFGILKGRFRILRTGILIEDETKIDDIFMTCCCLHNMLLDVDGLDPDWNAGVESDWAGPMGEFTVQELEHIPGVAIDPIGVQQLSLPRTTPFLPHRSRNPEEHSILNVKLIQHYMYARKIGCVEWPARNGARGD
jgi:hypothetical protein